MGKKDKPAAVAKDATTMGVKINVKFGANTFDVDGDVPDLQPIVELFRIWMMEQGDDDNDAPALEAQIQRLEQNTTDLDTAVKANTPPPSA